MLSLFTSPGDSLVESVQLDAWQAFQYPLSLVHTVGTLIVCFPYMIVTPIWAFSTLFIVLLPRVTNRLKAAWERRRIPTSRIAKGVWTIHGRRYDLTEFADTHPGGPWMLELGRNRDCTGLFESYHIFSDMTKLDRILARYELPESKAIKENIGPADNPTGLVFRDAFHEDVKKMARDHFRERGVSHKMKPWVFLCVLIVIAFEIIGLIGIVFYGYRVFLVIVPPLGWLLTGNVSHEASHFGLSSRPWVNTLFAMSSAPLNFNSTCWYIQHIAQHHVYTNDEDDVDLYHFLPVARTTRLSRWHKQFKLQWLSVWVALPTTVLHLSFVVPMDLLTGYIDPVTGTKRYEQCGNVEDLVAGARWSIILEFVLSFSLMPIMFYYHGLVTGFCWLAVLYSFSSLLFVVFTQGAHLQEQCMSPLEEADKSWGKRQVLTSLNFSPDSFFWSLASGGLNMQALHHILPTISSSHLMDMYPRFKEVCAKHNVGLKESDDIFSFFKGFYDWIKELSNEDPLLDNVDDDKASNKVDDDKVNELPMIESLSNENEDPLLDKLKKS